MVSNRFGRNLTEQLVHSLGEAIVKGDYNAEEGLPTEAALCEMYSVSRSATREAVKMLKAKGLVSSRPRQGIRIEPRDHWNIFDPDVLSWLLAGTPSLEMLKEFLQLRIVVEPEAAALAADNQNLEKIAVIGQALERMKAAEEGLEDPLEADISFHLSILSASDNPFYIQLRSFIAAALRVSIRYTNRIKGTTAASYNEHKKVYDAIAKGNASVARKVCRALQAEALELITSELNE